MLTSDTDISVTDVEKLLSEINPKIFQSFGMQVNLNGFDSLINDLETVLDNDVSSLQDLSKCIINWNTYIADQIGLVSIILEQYKNVGDVYDYLDSISIKDPDEFLTLAPKYKILANDVPSAIKVLEAKKSDLDRFIKLLKVILAKLISYDKYLNGNYYKVSGLIRSAQKRERNISFSF